MLEDHRSDGYWIEAFDINNDGLPDLVGYSLGQGEITWYKNPTWQRTLIHKFTGPVGMHWADGDGWNDIVICHDYGKSMVEADPEGGKIHWLQNPHGGRRTQWIARYIGRATAMHRLKTGYFTQDHKLQVLGLPIVGKQNDVHSVLPVLLYTRPDDVYNATEWESQVVVDNFYHVLHGVAVKKFRARDGSRLDSVLLASQEGITWLHYEPTESVFTMT
jgi:hypothetical protein